MLRQPLQPLDDFHGRQQPEIELLAAGFDGKRHLMLFGGRQDEYGMRRRLFQRFQQRIEGGRREHMDFVDYVNLVSSFAGGEVDLLPQIANVVHAGVGGSVNFNQVQETSLANGCTAMALVARPFGQVGIGAVDAFCQEAGRGGLAGATGAAEQISVTNPVGGRGLTQRAGNMLLSYHIIKPGRTPFAVKGLGHELSLALSPGHGNRRSIPLPRDEGVL